MSVCLFLQYLLRGSRTHTCMAFGYYIGLTLKTPKGFGYGILNYIHMLNHLCKYNSNRCVRASDLKSESDVGTE